MNPINAQSLEEAAAGIWSVSSRIQHALVTAESRFGPRDTSYEILGYGFRDKEPRTAINHDQRTVEIWLADYAQADFPQAIYQLSHEVIHLLAPLGSERPTNLEEGLATLFSEQYVKEAINCSASHTIESYQKARDAVAAYLIDDACLRSFRQTQPVFSRVTPELLIKVQPKCSQELADFLCTSFKR